MVESCAEKGTVEPDLANSIVDMKSPLFEPVLSVARQQMLLLGAEPGRVFHGRGQCFAGLEWINVDILPPVILITLYQACDEAALNELAVALTEAAGQDSPCVVLQRRYCKPVIFAPLLGAMPDNMSVTEAGLLYDLDFKGLHTGLFLDMAAARRWVGAHSAGCRVLNLFAHTCAFSVAAIAGDALSVINLDMNRAALERGRKNHRLNNQDINRVKFLAHDVFRSWGKLKRLGPYDLVIIDPPSYQPGSFVSAVDYQRVIRRIGQLLAPGGELLACLNDPAKDSAFLASLLEEYCPTLNFKGRVANPQSFADADPERGLKVLCYG